MKYWISIYIILVFYHQLDSQTTYLKSIDVDSQPDGGNAIEILSDGYIISGNSLCFDNTIFCISLVKTDFQGNLVWKNQFKDINYTIKLVDSYGNHGLIHNNKSKLYSCGIIETSQSMLDCFIMKFNPNGESIWLKKYGSQYNDFSSSLLQTTDSTLLLFSDLASDDNNDVIWLMETDLDGNKLWEQTYGELNKNVVRQDILQLDDGNIVFSHLSCDREETCFFGDTFKLNITKVDKKGKEIWSNDVYRFTEPWSHNNIISLDNGGFVASFHRVNFDPGWWYPPILIFIDSFGKVENEFHFPDQAESIINDMILNSSGDIIGVGYMDKFDLGFAGWIFSISQNGTLNWSREIVDLRFPDKVLSFNSVKESENGGLVVTGFIYDTLENQVPTSRNENIVLGKFDINGCLEPNCSDLQIVAIEDEVSNNFGINLFPNPASDFIQVVIPNQFQSMFDKLSIVNLNGQILLTSKETQIDLQDIVSGVYCCVITLKDNFNHIIKFTVIK